MLSEWKTFSLYVINTENRTGIPIQKEKLLQSGEAVKAFYTSSILFSFYN